MEFGLHGLLVRYSNVATDIMIAAETGYDAVELHTDKLDRYLAAGLTGGDIKTMLDRHAMKVSCIDIIGDVETQDPRKFEGVLRKAELLSKTAQAIGCQTIQLNAFCELEARSEKDNIVLTAANIRKICEIGHAHGVRFQYEGAAWTPIHSIRQCLDLVDEVAMDNFGLVIDFWHFWASRGGTPDDISRIDKHIIYGVHIADGFRPAEGDAWVDETLLRGALPGDGEIPCARWIEAVQATGFDGTYSGEILCHKLWEANLHDIAADALQRMKAYF